MQSASIISLVVVGTALVINALRYRDALYPAFLQSGIWFAVILGLLLAGNDYFTVSALTYSLVIVGVVAFSAGCYTSTFGFIPRMQPLRIARPDNLVTVVLVLATIACALFPIYLANVLALAASGPTDNLLINIRLGRGDEDGSLGAGAYGAVVSLVLAVVCLLHRHHLPRASVFLAILLLLAYAALTSGRTSSFFAVIALGSVLTITRSVGTLKLGAIAAATLLGIFVLIGATLSKGITVEEGGPLWYDVHYTISNYFLSPLPAFDVLLRSDPSLTHGASTLRFWFALLHQLGFETDVQPLVQEFVYVPAPTNVYTFYQPYFLDFGLIGAAFVQFPFGMLYGYLYRLAAKGHDLAILMYSLLMYPLFMQFFQDQYFNLLSTWLQIGACLLLYWAFTRRALPFRLQSNQSH